MTFRCEDLRDFGLVLLPPSSPEYDYFLANIQQRLDNPSPEAAVMPQQFRRAMSGEIIAEERATSAILLNQSGKTIAAIDAVWRYEDIAGRAWSGARMTTGRAVLLPFSASPRFAKIEAYWRVIFPESKRYLGKAGMAGDNTDVRLPAPDEVCTSGVFFGTGGGGGCTSRLPIQQVTLILDGVFFTDGEFAGPNRLGLWDRITTEAKARMEIATLARHSRDSGAPVRQILDKISKLTGPATDRPPAPTMPVLQQTYRELANEIESHRRAMGYSATVDQLAAQADTKLPDFRKR